MIRRVEAKDVKSITGIYNGYVEHGVASFETQPLTEEEMLSRIMSIVAEYPYVVFEEGNTVVGFAYAHQWKERAAYHNTWETTVYVAPAYFRRGIGELLMNRIISDCRKAGCHALIACITGGNLPSCRLHEKLGFRQVSFFKAVGEKLGRQLDVVDYELLL